MEVHESPNWGCSAKEKNTHTISITRILLKKEERLLIDFLLAMGSSETSVITDQSTRCRKTRNWNSNVHGLENLNFHTCILHYFPFHR
jgi:hypothetical protein